MAGHVGFDRDMGATRALQGDDAADMLQATKASMAGALLVEQVTTVKPKSEAYIVVGIQALRP